MPHNFHLVFEYGKSYLKSIFGRSIIALVIAIGLISFWLIRRNRPPVIHEVTATPNIVISKEDVFYQWVRLQCLATDPNGDNVKYLWSCPKGEIDEFMSRTARYIPKSLGVHKIYVTVSDGREISIDSIEIYVIKGLP